MLRNNYVFIEKLYNFNIPTSRLCSQKKTKGFNSRPAKRLLIFDDSEIHSKSKKKLKTDETEMRTNDSLNCEETWKKREKTLSGYFFLNNSKKLIKKRMLNNTDCDQSPVPFKLSEQFCPNGNFKNVALYSATSQDCELYLLGKST